MLNKTDFKFLTNDILKKLCKKKGIKVSKMKKQELFESYNELLACKTIQNKFRNYFYKDAIDNITFEEVKFPCFIYRLKTGKCFFYSYDSIIKYIMKSGNVTDPCTRIVYTDTELKRLDTSAKFYFPEKNYKSTLKIKKNENYARRIKNRENEIMSYQMRLDEIKESILTLIENDLLSWNIGPIYLDNNHYRSIQAYSNTIIHELKILFLNLKSYNQFEANCFKKTFLDQINDTYFKNIINNL